jgi:hypothetical protein
MNPFLAAWSNFYVITGSSASGLTGLMFVVITLVAGQERVMKSMRDGVETFSSPTVVHFCAALIISATLSAPWPSLVGPGIVLAILSLSGTVYGSRVMFRMGRRTAYRPEFDDWFWYAIFPVTAYIAIFVASLELFRAPTYALYVVAGGTIALIFTGIRNAWDVVTFIAVERKSSDDSPE